MTQDGKKQRFRKLKQRQKAQEKESDLVQKPRYPYASASLKVKAFLTDSFMLLMPIMYTVFYLVMDGREGFAEHQLSGWFYILIPLIIVQTVFLAKTGQTPGYRAYELTLISESTGEKPHFGQILFRNLCAVLSFFSFFGWVMIFFRKDRKSLHDLLSSTAVIIKTDTPHAV